MITLSCTHEMISDMHSTIMVLLDQYHDEGLSKRRTVDWILEDLRFEFMDNRINEFLAYVILGFSFVEDSEITSYFESKISSFGDKYTITLQGANGSNNSQSVSPVDPKEIKELASTM